jgi:hypothetical protein
MRKVLFVVLAMVLVGLAITVNAQEDPFEEAATLAMRDGKIGNDRTFKALEFTVEKSISNGVFNLYISASEAGVVCIRISSKETQRQVMVTAFRVRPYLPEYVLVSGYTGASSYSSKKNITSTYARLLCKAFLEYWDELRSPSEGRLNEIPKIEY